MRKANVRPGRRRSELIGQEVVLCSERQMPRLFRQLHGRRRTGRLRGHHNHLARRRERVTVGNFLLSVPFAMAALFRAMLPHDPSLARRQWLQRHAPAALLLGVLLAGAGGCTVVQKDGLFYGNVGFEKQVSKVSIERRADGTEATVVEGVKNTTPQIVEAAVGAAVKNAK